MKDELIPLHDILREIEFLHSVRDRMTFEQFAASSVEVRAVTYSVLIISEATRRLPEDWLADFPKIPWHAVKAIGNKLRHEYQRLSDVILWGIAIRHSDELKATIEEMLKRHR